MNVRNAQNLSMLCDFYELTMSNGYFRNGYKDRITYFDLFFRQVPDGGGFAIAAGLEQVVEYITNLHFSDEDIDYLRSRGIFCEEFLQYLRNFRFTGDIYAVPEGTPVFPREPLITVRAPAIEAQLVETYLQRAVNHQSRIATKASRIVRAARGRAVMEIGSLSMVSLMISQAGQGCDSFSVKSARRITFPCFTNSLWLILSRSEHMSPFSSNVIL